MDVFLWARYPCSAALDRKGPRADVLAAEWEKEGPMHGPTVGSYGVTGFL